MRVTLIITEGPASLRAWNGLRLAAALQGDGNQVSVFLLDDGVYLAIRGQAPPERLSELASDQKLLGLLGMGVEVEACGVCLEHRGLDARALVEGVRPATMMDLARLIGGGDRVVSL